MGRPDPIFSAPARNRGVAGSTDYPALCVFVGLVIALLVSGYFALKNVDTDLGFRSEVYFQEWTKSMEAKIKEVVEEVSRGIRISGRESTDARAHLAKGYKYHRQKNYTEALVELNSAIEIDPRNVEAYYWRGRTLLSLGRIAEGEEDFIRAAKLRPDYADAYDQLGWLVSRQGRVDEGIAYLTKSIEFKPENAMAYYNRSVLFFSKGDVASAMRDAEKACSLGYQEGCKAHETFENRSKEGG
jgi:tetratricopeptide (TPR) repeat protein